MRSLLIDAGNSRIKWALLSGERVRGAQALDWSPRTLARIARQVMSTASAVGVDAVLVGSVAGRAVERALRRAARIAGMPAPRFVRSEHRAAGVTNGYRVPRRLGVDRWLALIAAHHAYPDSPVCVISIGTAMTIDLVDRHGRHRGGAIVPGPGLMVNALLRHTALIRARAAGGSQPEKPRLFAADTKAAIVGGSVHACAALISHAAFEAGRVLREPPSLVLTGGAAREVCRAGSIKGTVVDDFVLRGLAVLQRRRPR